MGRRKIDMEFLTDDRARKVTFCKRKGGLFKKAADLSKLCGCEVAVIVLTEHKTATYASTDLHRVTPSPLDSIAPYFLGISRYTDQIFCIVDYEQISCLK